MNKIFVMACSLTMVLGTAQAGLIGHWKLDEGTGATAADSSGHGHSGTLSNSPTWISTGVAGHALEFATNSLVVVPHDNALNPGITNTISIWVKPSGYGAPGPNFTPLLSKGDGYYNGYALLLTDTGKIIFQAGAAYGGSLASARAVPTNRWSQIVVTKSGGKPRMYIDGRLDRSLGYPYEFPGPGTNSAKLVLGQLAGALDDVRIYNHALTHQQVMGLFLAQDADRDGLVDANEVIAGTNPAIKDTDGDGFTDGEEQVGGTVATNAASYPELSSGLIGWWKMDETSGTTIADASGHNHTGTLHVSGGTAGWTSGVWNNALAFPYPGASAHARMTPSTTVTGQFTVALWASNADTGWPMALLDTIQPAHASFRLKLISDDEQSYHAFGAQIGDGTNWIVYDAGPGYNWNPEWNRDFWGHVGYVVTATNYTGYYNGVAVGGASYASASPVLLDPAQSITNLTVGAVGTTQGRFDEVRIYNRRLTDGEMAYLAEADPDQDGVSAIVEALLGTSPTSADTDGDGLDDGEEFVLGTIPTDSDTDNDGLPDGVDAAPTSFDSSSPVFMVTFPSDGQTFYP